MAATDSSDNLITIPRADAEKLLACADGTAALLYLHLRCTGSFSRTAAARELKCAPEEIARAAELLRRLGLMEKPEQPLPSRELPDYTAADLTQRAQSDPAFEGIIAEAERSFGRVLSSSDLKTLFGVYDHLGLPPEVVMLLLNHCVDAWQHSHGAGRRPSMRQVEKEAWHWADLEIMTVEAAEAHVRQEEQKREALTQVKALLQIRDRALIGRETELIGGWLELGYTPEAIGLAYERTIMNTGKLSLPYMDKIIRSWAQKQLYTPEEIETGDPARRTQRYDNARRSTGDGEKDDMQDLRALYARLKGGED